MTIRTFYILLMVIIISCGPPPPPPVMPTNACVLTSTTISTGTQRFLYGSDGNLEWLKNRADSTAVSDFSLSVFYQGTAYPMIQDQVFTGDNAGVPMDIFDGYPEESHVAQTEKGITKTGVFSYYYGYDSKKRIVDVVYQTFYHTGEYDVFINYDNQDNVSAVTLTSTSGPNITLTYTPLGYDDKINPISSMKGARFIFSSYGNPESLFTSLSKNNCLGYKSAGWQSVYTYEYNDKGYPLKKIVTNTNTVSGSSSSSTTSYAYECK